MSADNFDPHILGGSLKRGIVAPELLEERANRNFDQRELLLFLHGKKVVEDIHNTLPKYYYKQTSVFGRAIQGAIEGIPRDLFSSSADACQHADQAFCA